MVKGEGCCPGGIGCGGKARGRGAPTDPKTHRCPYQHSPGRAAAEDPKRSRKAAQTQQPPKGKKKNTLLPPEEEEEGSDWTTGPNEGLEESTKWGRANPSDREFLLQDKDTEHREPHQAAK